MRSTISGVSDARYASTSLDASANRRVAVAPAIDRQPGRPASFSASVASDESGVGRSHPAWSAARRRAVWTRSQKAR